MLLRKRITCQETFSVLVVLKSIISNSFLCAVRNNYNTRHLAKILIHLAWCLQECVSTSGAPSVVYGKALNALYISSIFLKYLIETAKTNKIEELHLFLDETEPAPTDVTEGMLLVMYQLVGCIFINLFLPFVYLVFFSCQISLLACKLRVDL